jgi:hypothetical protein
MQAGHSVLVTGFTARLPVRPARLDPPPEPRYRRRTGTEPAPGPGGMPPGRSQGQARMTLPAATAPDAEGRTPARGTQL